MTLLDLHLSAFPLKPVPAFQCELGFAQRISHPSWKRDPASSCFLGSPSFLAAARAVFIPSSEGHSSVLEPAEHCHVCHVQGYHRWLLHIMTACTQTCSVGTGLHILEAPTGILGPQLWGPPSCLLKLPPPCCFRWILLCELPSRAQIKAVHQGSSRIVLFFVLQTRGAFQ